MSLLRQGVALGRALNLYPAAGITLFGVAVAWLLGVDGWPLAPYWLCGALLVYNLDRASDDPADAANVPGRCAALAPYRGLSRTAALLAAAGLLALPIIRQEWRLAALIWGGSAVCVWYSLPLPLIRQRLKDLPAVSTLFPALAIAAALLGLLGVEHAAAVEAETRRWGLIGGWTTALLLANVMLCDWRDTAGDERAGVRSLPVILGQEETRRMLFSLVAVAGGCSMLLGLAGGDAPAMLVTIVPVLWLGGLIMLRRWLEPWREFTFEWLVDASLYLTALAMWLCR